MYYEDISILDFSRGEKKKVSPAYLLVLGMRNTALLNYKGECEMPSMTRQIYKQNPV